MTPAVRPMTPAEWGMLLFLSVLWGGSFFFIAVAGKQIPPLTMVLMRVSLAALALHIVLRLRGQALPASGAALFAYLGMCLLSNVIPFSLIVWGQTRIGAGLASILNATTPIFTVLVVHFLTTDEKLNWHKAFGVLLGFAGVVVLMGGDALSGLGGNIPAQLAVLGAALSYGFSGAFGRRFARMGIKPLEVAAGQTSASTMIMLPLALLVDQPWNLPVPGWPALGAVMALALVSTAFAYIIFFRLMASAGATNVGLVTLLVPVTAILLGALILGESLRSNHFAGMALISLSLIAIDGRLIRRFFPVRTGEG